MAPMVTVSKNDIVILKNIKKSLKNEKENLLKLRNYIEKNFEYVGSNFSKKVREIYYDKKSKEQFMELQHQKKEKSYQKKN